MDIVRLRVRTVPVSDLTTNEEFTIYTVISNTGYNSNIQCSSGFTLRDAISSFCSVFCVERESVHLLRPFLPQGMEDNGEQWLKNR